MMMVCTRASRGKRCLAPSASSAPASATNSSRPTRAVSGEVLAHANRSAAKGRGFESASSFNRAMR
jgi:hypothetical protein